MTPPENFTQFVTLAQANERISELSEIRMTNIHSQVNITSGRRSDGEICHVITTPDLSVIITEFEPS